MHVAYPAMVDSKGRIIIPEPLRDRLPGTLRLRPGPEGTIRVGPAPDGPCEGYRVEPRLTWRPHQSRRLTVPPSLRAYAGLRSGVEVVWLVGPGPVQIMPASRWTGLQYVGACPCCGKAVE